MFRARQEEGWPTPHYYSSITWPLQNIPIMVDRVTRQRPRLFGKMDMTSGFFQTAIDERSRPFTAFITSTGLYQWCRLPMRLKGAASYFQRMMASKVLAGMLYSMLSYSRASSSNHLQPSEQIAKHRSLLAWSQLGFLNNEKCIKKAF